MTWNMHGDPMMWVAGIRALYLQALHPRAVRGVLQNSDFRRDAWGRLLRTAGFVGTTTYGTTGAAEKAGARVRRIHGMLSATDPETGESYRIDTPELLLWVHCAEIDSYLHVLRRSGFPLTDAQADRYIAEHRESARLVGLDPDTVPAGRAELAAYFDKVRPELAAALQHRGVTVVHDFGECDGVLYLVMELLDGRDLSRLLDDEHRPLAVPDIVEIAEQVAAALAYTHRQGIVHRDLKPANIMRLTDGTVKICDFGIARLGHDVGFTVRLTGTGIAMGTPHYMSPEQIGGTEVDQRSDLYSLGCVLYEIATGAPPFDLGDTWAILVGHRAELPEYLERIILDLLAKHPGQRPRDAHELCRRISAGRTASAHVPMVAAPRPRPPQPAGREGRLPSWTRGMITGPKATGTALRTTPPDPAAGLTGEWTTRAFTAGTGEPAPDARPGPPPATV
ncbi:oxygenase MpaB family protein, partial [Streptomyces sp. NTH33]|uniref:oxygenase MpaB family protein n=1 Tax=Streptomyces sp. NTH33 TaxID=1735453 RepID=UPI0021ACF2F1